MLHFSQCRYAFTLLVVFMLLFSGCDTGNYDLEVIEGTWYGSSGFGVAEGADGSFQLYSPYVQILFSNVKTILTTVLLNVTSTASWDMDKAKYHDSGLMFPSHTVIKINYANKLVSGQKLEKNTWCYTFPDNERTVTIKLTSKTTAEIIEEGFFWQDYIQYRYHITYRMNKSSQ